MGKSTTISAWKASWRTKMMIDPSLPMRPRRVELSWRKVDDEVIILDLASSEYLALNRVGAFLWEMLEETADRAQLVGALVDRYGVPDEQACRDVEEFLTRCDEKGLLEQEEST